MKKADEIRQAELRGYSRGYQTGCKKRAKDRAAMHEKKRLDAQWNRAFLAALPAALVMQDWAHNGKSINTISDRISLATRIANRAVEYMR